MEVVTTEQIEESIIVIKMEDRESRNTFSPELILGLERAFIEVENNPTVKVVVIHGFDSYFCCGGTKNELLRIYKGEITFADLSFYRSLLDCPVPTIAAMQGHALGGGLAYGAYADVIIMAEECLYSTNFMKYGFTPGMGSTYIIPKKFGELLGSEMLYSAQNYHGGELKRRGIPTKVVKKNEVIPAAITLAKELAEKSLISLKLLKSHLNQTILKELPKIIEQELAMHEISFKQPEVKDRIESLFGA